MSTKGSVGFKCILTAGGVTIARSQNVNGPNVSKTPVDVTTRDGNGWKEFLGGLKEWDAEVEHLFVGTDTGLQALRSAFLNDSELAVVFTDDSGHGWSGNCIVTKLGFNQPLDGAVAFPVSLKGTGALTAVGGTS